MGLFWGFMELLSLCNYITPTINALGRAKGEETVSCKSDDLRRVVDEWNRKGYEVVPGSGGVAGRTGYFNVRKVR
jgi:hypothetical protein